MYLKCGMEASTNRGPKSFYTECPPGGPQIFVHNVPEDCVFKVASLVLQGGDFVTRLAWFLGPQHRRGVRSGIEP